MSVDATLGFEPLRPNPGSVPAVDNFVGRTSTTFSARRRLTSGQNLLLTDPRRMGKTFWMRYFCATTTDFEGVLVDYQGVRTADEFLTRTVDRLRSQGSIRAKALTVLESIFSNVTVEAGPVTLKPAFAAADPGKLLRDMVLAVDKAAAGGLPLLVCLDEVPAAILSIAETEGATQARAVLQTLRALRHETKHIRWILAGSIGFHHVLRTCSATTGEIGDLQVLQLGPMADDEARELVCRLLRGIKRPAEEEAVQQVVTCCGGIPFLIQQLANLLDNGSSDWVDAGAAVRTFDRFARDRDLSEGSTHLLSRIEVYFGDHEKLAFAILDRLAVSAGPVPFETLVQQCAGSGDREMVLATTDWLTDDHYLIEVQGGLSWRYGVLRDIYRIRRRLGGGIDA